MFDGYDSCSEDTSSSSSSDESEEEVSPLPSSLPIIKNNGQVYTYPDGKSGMGEYVVCEYKHFDASFSALTVFCGVPVPNVGPLGNGPLQWISCLLPNWNMIKFESCYQESTV